EDRQHREAVRAVVAEPAPDQPAVLARPRRVLRGGRAAGPRELPGAPPHRGHLRALVPVRGHVVLLVDRVHLRGHPDHGLRPGPAGGPALLRAPDRRAAPGRSTGLTRQRRAAADHTNRSPDRGSNTLSLAYPRWLSPTSRAWSRSQDSSGAGAPISWIRTRTTFSRPSVKASTSAGTRRWPSCPTQEAIMVDPSAYRAIPSTPDGIECTRMRSRGLMVLLRLTAISR